MRQVLLLSPSHSGEKKKIKVQIHRLPKVTEFRSGGGRRGSPWSLVCKRRPLTPRGSAEQGLRTRRPSAGQEGTRRGPQLRRAGSGRRDLLPSRLHSPESRQRGRRNTRPETPHTAAPLRLRQLHSGLTAPLPANCPLFPAAARVTGAAEAQKTLSAFFKDVFHWRTTKSRGELGPAERKHRRGYTALEENE